MGGVEARQGFWFQDARVLVRLLLDAVRQREARLGEDVVPPPIRIRIEAAIVVGASTPADGLPRPLWDSITYEGGTWIVDETKLGDVSKEERIALYARIRATAAVHPTLATIAPRLTTARGAQENETKWRGLAAASTTTIVPALPPDTVSTAAELAAEALFYLVSGQLPSRRRSNRGVLVDAPTLPMSEVDARAVLGRFIFDDELDLASTEAELQRLLGSLGGDFAIEESIRQLRGWIAETACAQQSGAELTCETLGRELRILARYLSWNAESELLVQRLRAARPPHVKTALTLRPWREVQPAAAVGSRPSKDRASSL